MSQDPDENADHPRRTKTKRVMVSTEENSLSDLLGAALPKGVLAGLPGLRGISSPDVPAFAAKPAIDAFSYGTATPAMGELAEAALAYTYDEPHAATTQAPVTLELVADNGPADEKSTDTLAQEQLEAARAAAVMEIEEMIEQARLNGDDEGKMRLEAILNSVKGAKTISAITAAQSLSGQASGGKVETPEQKRERLWNEMQALDKEASDILRPHMSDEEREKEDEYKRKIANARTEEERLAITKEYHDWRRNLQQDWLNSDDPNKQGAARQAEPAINKSEDRLKQMEGIAHEAGRDNYVEPEATQSTPTGKISGSIYSAAQQTIDSTAIQSAVTENTGQETTKEKLPASQNAEPQSAINLAYAEVAEHAGAPVGLPSSPITKQAAVVTTF